MQIDDELQKHYRPNVGILLFHPSGKVWLGRRVGGFDALDPETYMDGYRWQMPQGGIDPGEELWPAARRELQEETGITSVLPILMTPGWMAYDFPPEYARKNWRGQRQKWAVMVFTGEEGEVDLTADDHQEFDAWRWADLEEAPKLIVPFKRSVYIDLCAGMAPLRNQIAAGQFHMTNTAE